MDPSNSGQRAGLFNAAWCLSITGMVICLVGWGLLAVFMVPDVDAEIPQSTQRYLASMLAVLSVVSPIVHVGCRIIRNQRRILAALEGANPAVADPRGPRRRVVRRRRIVATQGNTGGGEVVHLPSPETVTAIRRLAVRLTSE